MLHLTHPGDVSEHCLLANSLSLASVFPFRPVSKMRYPQIKSPISRCFSMLQVTSYILIINLPSKVKAGNKAEAKSKQ